MSKISRRKFLVSTGAGGGVVFGLMYFGGCGLVKRTIAGVANTTEASYLGNTKTPLIWFEVLPNNKVVFSSPKVEMGQGTFTGLAQMAADELDIDIKNMLVQHAPSASGNLDRFGTGGSTSISSLWEPLRELAATMREMLRIEGSKMMNLSTDQVVAKQGSVSGEGKSMTYGEIAAKVTEWDIPKTPKLKDPGDYKYIGKPVPRVDLLEKVTGSPIYGLDASMPNMLFGAVFRPSSVAAKFISADVSAAKNMPGVVQIVEEEDFVAVVAESYYEAENAKAKVKVNWSTERNWQSKDIEEMILVGKGDPVVIQKKGNLARAFNDEDKVITSDFKSPIGAHAQIEPNAAVAHVTDEGATIIISTQVVEVTQKEVAKRLGIMEEQVNIIPTFLGGAFGRRLHTPHAMQAAVLSKAVGRPVKIIFSRQEEFQNDTFRPPTHHLLKARLGDGNEILGLEHNVSSGDVMYGSPLLPSFAQSLIGSDLGAWRGGMIQYSAIPSYKAISWRVKLPFATSWWRALGLLANTFAIESFIDELAIKVGEDAAEFRLKHIDTSERGNRLRKVIERVVEISNYSEELLPNGHALGLAASTDANTPVAQVAEVSVENKEIKVHKVWCAIDPGLAINPDQIRAQCEGAIIMGLSAAMFEKMEVVDGSLRPTIYGPYKMALMKHTPKDIVIDILQNSGTPGAVGEPPLGPIGAAIANAVFRVNGHRLRSMPFEIA